MDPTIKIALVGAGMFGGEVHIPVYADLQRSGISGQLARVGLDHWARDLAPVQFELAGIAAHSEESARRAQAEFQSKTQHQPKAYWGEKPWQQLLAETPDLDVLAVATPDSLHTEVILAGLRAGSHIITEKPMCLDIHEADQIIELARSSQRLVAVDMHKRYDPDHIRICRDLKNRIGEPLYGVAYLEEPLDLPAARFKWAEQSDPFTYVGPHWVDLICHYFQAKPVSLTAVGQKKLLIEAGINTYDAVQVRVDFANGLSMHFHNHWVTPRDFEAPVNQGHELVGTRGKIESDQQYRGLRWWAKGQGSHTANTHFIREINRPDGSSACVGYGVDSLTAALAAVCRRKLFGPGATDLASIYPNAEQARIVVGVVHAARIVRDLNFDYLRAGKGAPVSARFDASGITILDPNRAGEEPDEVLRQIYPKAF